VKKWIAVVVLVGLVFVVWRRQRVFVRDPLASVMRDGAKVGGEQVFVNFTNDVLLEKDSAPMMVMLMQRGQPIGVPDGCGCGDDAAAGRGCREYEWEECELQR